MTIKKKLYQQKPSVHVREIEDQLFLADTDTGVMFHLNPVGSAVWRLMESPVCIEEVIEILDTAFPDVGITQVSTDVRVLLEELSRHDLLVDKQDI